MGFLSGGSKQKSESGNKAYPWVKDTFGGPGGAAFGGSVGAYGDILGLNGAGAGREALDNYWNSSGGQFLLDQGLDGLTNKFTALGLSKSGAAMKGMETFRQGLASTKLDNYLGHLGKLGGMGLGAGGLVTQAGQWSKGEGSQKEGLGGLIGSIIGAAAMASDRALKRDISKVGELEDGLGVYDFDYRLDLDPSLPEGRQRGVMADEVAKLRPWALGPVRPDGYGTVHYGRL